MNKTKSQHNTTYFKVCVKVSVKNSQYYIVFFIVIFFTFPIHEVKRCQHGSSASVKSWLLLYNYFMTFINILIYFLYL